MCQIENWTDEIRRAQDLHYVLLSVKDDILQGVQRYPMRGGFKAVSQILLLLLVLVLCQFQG